MSINLVVCVNESFQMGNSKTNDLLYNIKKDMQRFIEKTKGNFVVMGRNTFESLPAPLKNRRNVVVTNNKKYNVDKYLEKGYDVIVEHNLETILNQYKYTGKQDKDLSLIGGSSIFAEGIHWCDEVYLTMVHDSDVPDGDIYFPHQELSNFKITYREKFYDEESDLYYTFIDYRRKGDE